MLTTADSDIVTAPHRPSSAATIAALAMGIFVLVTSEFLPASLLSANLHFAIDRTLIRVAKEIGMAAA